ncbi:hypothetical protein F4679DRAFT_598613 [Xylaria curta]|nr:hypothetical protein F4679DRAFT_598613 [Xylaria curta]
MVTSQTQESPLRLENLGHVSGYYGNPPTMKEWTPDKSHSSPVNSIPAKKPYVIQSINRHTSQLIPAKDQNRCPDVSKPEPISQRSQSEYRETSTESLHPEVLTPEPERDIPKDVDYFKRQPLQPSYAHTSRPATVFSAYRPLQSNRSEKSQGRIIRNSISLCESPGTYYEDHHGAHSSYINAKSSHTPSPPTYSQGRHLTREYSFLETNTSRAAQTQQHRTRSQTSVRVDGVDFDLVSNTPIGSPPPTPSSISPPVLSSSKTRRRRSSTVSVCSVRSTSSNNPGYGAWSPSPIRPGPLRPRKDSFINRTKEHIKRELVSAGWKTPPSFKVHSVTKSCSNLGIWEADGGKKSSVTPPSNEPSWAERMQKITPHAGHGEGIPSRQSLDQWRAGLPACALSPCPLKTKKSGLRIDTSFAYVPIPQGIAELEAPLDNPSKVYSDDSYDSLFLNRKDGVRHQVSAPMFPSEYTQTRAVALNTESKAGRAEWRPPSVQDQMSRAQSAVSTHHWSHDERVDPRAIPPPLSLGQSCTADNRRSLPSRHQQHDAVNRRTLTRKKGMMLR